MQAQITFSVNKDHMQLEILGYCLLTVTSAVAYAGGIGGGGIIFELFHNLYGYTIQETITLSSATMLSGAIINMLMIITKPYPTNSSEHLIDFGLLSIIIPVMLAGTAIGVIMTNSLPEILMLSLLTAYLICATFSTCQKAYQASKEETKTINLHSTVKKQIFLYEYESKILANSEISNPTFDKDSNRFNLRISEKETSPTNPSNSNHLTPPLSAERELTQTETSAQEQIVHRPIEPPIAQ